VNSPVNCHSSATEKIALFRGLFRGRDDVYPRRFTSRSTGRSGYQPACANEWAHGLCDKSKIRCAECPNRSFLPLTDDVIRRHLSGQDETGKDFVAGIYPMLQDETCYFLAADFDGVQWREDVMACMQTCREMAIPAALERSRSGHGGHIWLFFTEAIAASLARKLGSCIITETMERRPDLGLHSYDRFFPNQDTLPHGGFGNLIALPLQKQPRKNVNSIFLDENLEPYPDQWVFLASLAKISRTQTEGLVEKAESRQRILGVPLVSWDEDNTSPWIAPSSRRRKELPIPGPLPENLELVLGNQIYIAKEGLSPGLRNRLVRMAAFQNPEFYKAQAMRLSTYGKPRIIACAEDFPHHLALPRGLLADLRRLLVDLGIKFSIHDERCCGHPLNVSFQGALRPEQKLAAGEMAAHDIGVLAATTAFGKTVVAAWLIAQRHVNTLVLVHRRQLLEQWVDRLAAFLGLPVKDIGQIGGGRKKPSGQVDVAILQSLARKGVVDDMLDGYGHIVVDECHHVSAACFEQVVRHARAKYVTGLSATVTRKDGRHPIIFMQCGPVRFRVDAKRQALAQPFTHRVIVRPTGFYAQKTPDPDVRHQFCDLYDELTADEDRNRLIVTDVVQAAHEGRSPLVLTERVDHLQALAELLSPHIRNLAILRASTSRKKRSENAARLAAIPEDEERVVLSTGKYVGEGFDDARLDTLFLTLPVSWRGTIAQYSGRLHRLHDRKHEVRIYDYADVNVPMLARMFDRRCKGYEAVGYTIQIPASAISSWPSDVPLPCNQEWKRDYLSSVRRLVRDGVDRPLAYLFNEAAHPIPPDLAGAARARSAAEAFLYRRLETLPEAKGKFRLNVVLSIPFDGCSSMEVDFLCTDLHIAIELDGAQHFMDPDAYRRDRRKDALLQENGYFVLRFMAEDACKRLDDVLNTILRTLSHRLR
jgi:superfamily II DNA or RNA helicase/very-short-patch-repair endonuclease